MSPNLAWAVLATVMVLQLGELPKSKKTQPNPTLSRWTSLYCTSLVKLNFAINIFSIYIGEGGEAGEARGEAEEAREAGARGRKTKEAAEPLLPVLPGSEEEGSGGAPPGARRAAQQEGADQSPGGEVEGASGRGTEGQYSLVMDRIGLI